MREVDRDGLVAACEDPLVHHQLDLDQVVRAWVEGPAVVVQHGVGWSDAPDGALAMLCLGPAAALDPLVARVAEIEPEPWRVVVEAASEPALPVGWRPRTPSRWHWMLTRVDPGPARTDGPGESGVVEVADDEVEALLDEANPGSHARPGTPGLEVWLGVRDRDGVLASVGALVRQTDGTGHLRGITTRPTHRGRGLGEAVTRALTTRALARGSGVATLGVYTDNEVAVRLYRRLRYDVVHTFTSGLTAS